MRAGFDVVLANEFSTEPEWSYRANLLRDVPEGVFPERPESASNGARRRYRALVREQINKERESLLEDYDRHMRGGDIAVVLPDHWLREWTRRRGEVDVVVGGPPCQGFSSAGARDPQDVRNQLPDQAIRVIRQLKPKIAIIENVPGMLNRFSDRVLEVGMALAEPVDGVPGYHVVAELVHGELLGVPQTRRRLLLIAVREDLITEKALDRLHPLLFPTGCPSRRLGCTEEGPWVEHGSTMVASDILGDLARSPEPYGRKGTTWLQGYRTERPTCPYQREMRALRHEYLTGAFGGPGFEDRYANHDASVHDELVAERMRLLRQAAQDSDEGRSNRCASGWLRQQFMGKHPHLKTNKASQRVLLADAWPNLTVTSLPDDIVHFEEDRIPTVREVARLQTFPDWFEFKGVRTSGAERRRAGIFVPHYTQVANAVPPRLAHAAASRVQWFLEQVDAGGLRDCDFALPGGDYKSPNRGTSAEQLDALNRSFREASARLVRGSSRAEVEERASSAERATRPAVARPEVKHSPVEGAGAVG